MQVLNLTLIPFDLEIERNAWKFRKTKREALQTKEELEEEMANPPRQTIEGYCKKTDVRHISLDFQPGNPITFDIQNFVLLDRTRSTGKNLRSIWINFMRHVWCASHMM